MDSGNYHSRLLQKEKVGTQESCSIDLLQDSSQLIGCSIMIGGNEKQCESRLKGRDFFAFFEKFNHCSAIVAWVANRAPTVGLTKLPVFAVLEERPPFASTQLEMFMAFTRSNSDKIL